MYGHVCVCLCVCLCILVGVHVNSCVFLYVCVHMCIEVRCVNDFPAIMGSGEFHGIPPLVQHGPQPAGVANKTTIDPQLGHQHSPAAGRPCPVERGSRKWGTSPHSPHTTRRQHDVSMSQVILPRCPSGPLPVPWASPHQ
jgi:hypothetical protein